MRLSPPIPCLAALALVLVSVGCGRESASAPAITVPQSDAVAVDPAPASRLPTPSAAAPATTVRPAESTIAPATTTAAWPPRLDPEPAEVATLSKATGSAAARSPGIAPPPWDAAAYRRDPQTYLAEALPGRVNQTATPAADMPFLIAAGPTGFRVAPLARVSLRVRGEPWMPVTLTSFGLGTFLRTGLATVTVPADGDGLASATWVATAGTVGHVSILAGSPERAGQVSFLITVTE